MHRLQASIYGNRDLLKYLRNQATFYCDAEHRELDLTLIDYDQPDRNVYEVTEEFSIHNGRHGNREDVVFLINGIPVVVIECKNANKDEAIALGVDQVRRYHAETPELFVPEMVFTATEAIGFSYGVTWNTIRRNIFNWKDEKLGNLRRRSRASAPSRTCWSCSGSSLSSRRRTRSFRNTSCGSTRRPQCSGLSARGLDAQKRRGLIWHTQGSGKTSR